MKIWNKTHQILPLINLLILRNIFHWTKACTIVVSFEIVINSLRKCNFHWPKIIWRWPQFMLSWYMRFPEFAELYWIQWNFYSIWENSPLLKTSWPPHIVSFSTTTNKNRTFLKYIFQDQISKGTSTLNDSKTSLCLLVTIYLAMNRLSANF